ncbi:uncharacterized protein [Physcomitrium patens]|uniref:uncharacterized protein isoform X1 n=1 Tax=Physcomitrium patens TaxID=3218 RepID=UPI00024AAF6E|nr:uncharacterized protein LOC112273110 isoform X1 [Physcomitrium patens]|eukprot:XP_024357280.1 uncharacterized protein LOC112273110 isoform X1 [Physcomitrella patens]
MAKFTNPTLHLVPRLTKVEGNGSDCSALLNGSDCLRLNVKFFHGTRKSGGEQFSGSDSENEAVKELSDGSSDDGRSDTNGRSRSRVEDNWLQDALIVLMVLCK